MRHIFSVLTLAAFSGVAVADVIPPEGFKLVNLDYKITTDKEIPDYLFFTIIEKNVTPLKFDPKAPIIILADDRRLRYLLDAPSSRCRKTPRRSSTTSRTSWPPSRRTRSKAR